MKFLLLSLALVLSLGCRQPEEGTNAECGISCEGTYPVACVVERIDGPFWTCAMDEETCVAIPGEVCLQNEPTTICVNEDGSRGLCVASPRCSWAECGGEATCCPDSHRVHCAAGICGTSEAACAPYEDGTCVP